MENGQAVSGLTIQRDPYYNSSVMLGSKLRIILPSGSSEVSFDSSGSMVLPEDTYIDGNPSIGLTNGKVNKDGVIIAEDVTRGDTTVSGNGIEINADGEIEVPYNISATVTTGDGPEILLPIGGEVNLDGSVNTDRAVVGNTTVNSIGNGAAVAPDGTITVTGTGTVKVDDLIIILPAGSGEFCPNKLLSRAQLAQILFNREGRPAVNFEIQFKDVSNTAWYAEAIHWAASTGIVGGYGNGYLGPNDYITREQLAVMLWRYSGSPAAAGKELHFSDMDEIGAYSLEALQWAVEHEIVNGYSDGRLNPKGQATRAQAAQMLMNFLKDR